MQPHKSTVDADRALTAVERRWLARLQRTLDAQPQNLVIYCHGTVATVLDRRLTEQTDDLIETELSDAPAIRTAGWKAGGWR